MNNEQSLWNWYNKKGCINLKVQYSDNDAWTKRIPVSYLFSLRIWEWVKGTYDTELGRPMTRQEFTGKINHRSVLDIEVMLDVDDTEHPFLEFTTIKEKARFIYQSLHKNGYKVKCYFTNSKSYHLSFIEAKLRRMHKMQREAYKLKIITKYGCDEDLAHDGHMVSMEDTLHYKSGKKKTEVFFSA